MKATLGARVFEKVVDPSCPWNLPRLKVKFRKYPYKMTSAEWKGLLARANQGDAEAEWEVAERYSDGCRDRSGKILVRYSARKAAEWFRRSAEHGFAPAQNTLGVVLSDRKTGETNRHEALAWLKKAFRGGDSCAANNIARTYRENGNLRRAVYWFRKSLASGDDGAYVQLGIHNYWGKGAGIDHMAAVGCFRKAIRGRSISEGERDDAFFYLGMAYLEGKGVRKSSRTAQRLLQQANVDNDHPAAFRLLNQMTKRATKR